MKVMQTGPRERRAVGLSVLLHACLAPLFATTLLGTADLRPEDMQSQTGVITVTIRHHADPAAAQAQPKPVQSNAPSPAPQAVRHMTVSVPKLSAATHRATGSHSQRRIAIIEKIDVPTPAPTASRPAPPSSAPVSALQASAAGAGASAAPSASPEPTASAAVVAAIDAPIGGWGQDFHAPIVLDDEALAALRSRYHGAVAHIEVDEDGHATSVTVAGGGLDADAVAEIQRHLMAVRYVPAERNGLRCAGAFDLHV
jgi:hypothetical protein